MTGTLFKTANVTFTPGSVGFPAVPGVPAIPDRWVSQPLTEAQQQTQVSEQGLMDQLIAQLRNQNLSQSEFLAALDSLTLPGFGAPGFPASLLSGTQPPPIFVPGSPAIPGVPGSAGSPTTQAVDLNLGWNNANGRSVQDEASMFTAEVTVSQQTVGAVFGMNTHINTGPNVLEISHGFSFQKGAVTVFEAGDIIVISPATVSSGAVFKIIRDAEGVITYFIDDVLKYTSLVPSIGIAFIDGVIYSADGV